MFGDAQLSGFLRSMPFQSRRQLVMDALGRPRLIALTAICCVVMVSSAWLGSRFPLSASLQRYGSVMGLAIGGIVWGMALFMYRNAQMRRYLLARTNESGQFTICPVCKQRGEPGADRCGCGCLSHPFASVD